jgi:hypothetical protein
MKIFNRLSAILIVCVLIFITGCEKTEPDVTTTDRDKFIGTWDGQSDGPNGHRNFSLVIIASVSAPDQIKMENFDGGTGIVFANVSGNALSIPSQIVSSETIQGSGNLSGGTISFTFSIDDGQTIENRTATANNKH